METTAIKQTATSLDAKGFIEFLDKNNILYCILDQDNLMDENDGYLNIEIEGFPEGESLLFVDGEYEQ